MKRRSVPTRRFIAIEENGCDILSQGISVWAQFNQAGRKRRTNSGSQKRRAGRSAMDAIHDFGFFQRILANLKVCFGNTLILRVFGVEEYATR